jgi:8-oxo-dGTP diphosphatase
MKNQGASIVLLNSRGEVLLCLRDDRPEIPYPGRWDLLGGHVEPDETPLECIVREIREEIGYDSKGPTLFRRFDLADRIESMFWEPAEIDITSTTLTEGQRLQWFSRDLIRGMPEADFAFGFRTQLLEFFAAHRRPAVRPSPDAMTGPGG